MTQSKSSKYLLSFPKSTISIKYFIIIPKAKIFYQKISIMHNACDWLCLECFKRSFPVYLRIKEEKKKMVSSVLRKKNVRHLFHDFWPCPKCSVCVKNKQIRNHTHTHTQILFLLSDLKHLASKLSENTPITKHIPFLHVFPAW